VTRIRTQTGPEMPADEQSRLGRRVLRNFGLLFGGRAGAALFALAATALTARALAPAAFGLVVLIHAYTLLFRGLANLQSQEAVVRFVSASQSSEAGRVLAAVLRRFLALDLVLAVAGYGLAVAAAPLAAVLLDWTGPVRAWVVVYASIILVSPSATLIGLLRVYNRYDLLAVQPLLRQLVRLGGVVTAVLLEAGMAGFLAAWYAGLVCEQCWVIGMGWREKRRRLGALQAGRGEPLVNLCPGIARFAAYSYGQGLLDLATRQLTTLFIGGLLDARSAGYYRLARELTKALAQSVTMIREALLPDLARLWAQDPGAFRGLVVRTGGIAGGVGLALVVVLFFAAEPLIVALMGPSYAAAAPLLMLLMLAAVADLVRAPLRPALYAIGRNDRVFRINLLALGLSFSLLFALTPALGLMGAGLAAIVASSIALTAMLLTIRPYLLSRGACDESGV